MSVNRPTGVRRRTRPDGVYDPQEAAQTRDRLAELKRRAFGVEAAAEPLAPAQ